MSVIEKRHPLVAAVAEVAEARHARPPGTPRARPLDGGGERVRRREEELRALRAAGTRHVYADTADLEALAATPWPVGGDGFDGNTANQPLVAKVVERELERARSREWVEALEKARESPTGEQLVQWLYTVLLTRIGHEMVRWAGERTRWRPSLQLHMGVLADPEEMRRAAWAIHQAVEGALVKVPFTPEHPHALLVARDLEREGIAVNFTSTFSARQVLIAAALADVTRTNVFLGRIDAGLDSPGIGEQVCLSAQRSLRDLRAELGLKTLLIVASIRDGLTIARLAGCDVFTAPLEALEDFVERGALTSDRPTRAIAVDADWGHLAPEPRAHLGRERVARLWRVDDDLVAFLRRFRESTEFRTMSDGAALRAAFEEAGHGDVFHSPTPAERERIAASKLPVAGDPWSLEVALDTQYTLRANADFVKHQATIDEALRRTADDAADG